MMNGQENDNNKMKLLKNLEDDSNQTEKDKIIKSSAAAVFDTKTFMSIKDPSGFYSDNPDGSCKLSPILNPDSMEELKSSIYELDKDTNADSRWVYRALYAIMCSPSDELNDLFYDILLLRDDPESKECANMMEVMDMIDRRSPFTMEYRYMDEKYRIRDMMSPEGDFLKMTIMSPAMSLMQEINRDSDINPYLDSILEHMDNPELCESCFDICISALYLSTYDDKTTDIVSRLTEYATTPRRALRLKQCMNNRHLSGTIPLNIDYTGFEKYRDAFERLGTISLKNIDILFDLMVSDENLRGACMIEIANIMINEMKKHHDTRRQNYAYRIMEYSRIFDDTQTCYRVSTKGL